MEVRGNHTNYSRILHVNSVWYRVICMCCCYYWHVNKQLLLLFSPCKLDINCQQLECTSHGWRTFNIITVMGGTCSISSLSWMVHIQYHHCHGWRTFNIISHGWRKFIIITVMGGARSMSLSWVVHVQYHHCHGWCMFSIITVTDGAHSISSLSRVANIQYHHCHGWRTFSIITVTGGVCSLSSLSWVAHVQYHHCHGWCTFNVITVVGGARSASSSLWDKMAWICQNFYTVYTFLSCLFITVEVRVIITVHPVAKMFINKITTKNYKHSPAWMRSVPSCAAPSFCKVTLVR